MSHHDGRMEAGWLSAPDLTIAGETKDLWGSSRVADVLGLCGPTRGPHMSYNESQAN